MSARLYDDRSLAVSDHAVERFRVWATLTEKTPSVTLRPAADN